MSAQPEHTRPGGFPYPLTLAEFYEPAAWCSFSCTIESRCYAAGEIIVLWVEGEVDLCTLPTLAAALDESLDQYPAHLLVDLGRVPFCAVRGLDLLTQTGRTVAENAIGYAVTGVLPQIDRVWTLCWDGDHLPVRYPSTTAAITAIRAAESERALT
jgi:anti-anti-sigma factor